MGVDAQGETWVAVAEVLGLFLDGDTPGEHDAGVVMAELVDAFLAGSGHRTAKEHATEVIGTHLRPDGTSRAPMRTAEARLSLATVSAREGDLEGAVSFAISAYEFDTKPMSDLLSRGRDVGRLLQSRYGNHSLVTEFREYLASTTSR